MSAADRSCVEVVGIGLWLPGHPNADSWSRRGQADRDAEVPPKPTGLAFDRVNRRRASQMGRAIGDAVAEAMAQAEVDTRTTPVIVGSSIGEAGAMIGLLDQMWRAREPMSPAVFTVSVHNAASGLLSISMKNKGYTTSIAADHDTPAATLFEGIALLATGEHDAVCCVCADEAAPKALLEHLSAAERHDWEMLAAAVVLRAARATPRTPAPLARLRMVTSSDSDARTIAQHSDIGADFVHSPQAGMLDLVDAVQCVTRGHLRLDRGQGRGFTCELLDLDNSDDGSGRADELR